MSSGGGGLEEEHEEHENHEAWVIPYADMLTLLMALFLVLFAISSVDLAKFKMLANSLGNAFSGSGTTDSNMVLSPAGGGDTLLEGTGPSFIIFPKGDEAEAALAREQDRELLRQDDKRRLTDLESKIRSEAEAAGLEGTLELRQEARGLVVTIVADNVLFEPGSSSIRAEGREILGQVGKVVNSVPNDVIVEGHTDSVPISTYRFRSNWELSTSRATGVLQYLVNDSGLDPRRISASGYADQKPIDTNETAEGRARNRRVEITIVGMAPAK